MGNCISSPDSVEPTIPEVHSTPTLSTSTAGPATTPVQTQTAVPETDNVGFTPEHIADREGGRGQ